MKSWNGSKSLYHPLCLLMSIRTWKLYLQRLKHKADNLSMDNWVDTTRIWELQRQQKQWPPFSGSLKFNEQRMAGISELMFRDPNMYIEEKDPTCYTCRRDYATELSIAFSNHPDSMSFVQYLMGHQIENRLFRRNDFTDEYYLHTMKQMIEESHRINRIWAELGEDFGLNLFFWHLRNNINSLKQGT